MSRPRPGNEQDPPGGLPRTVHVLDAPRVLDELARSGSLRPEGERRWLEGETREGHPLRIHPALVAPMGPDCGDLMDHLDELPDALGPHMVVLLQAGRASLGWFEGGEIVETKSFSRYVVRGKGRAQPTHLNAKGKSRYGSRLRLQNARALLAETNERIGDWWETYGPAEVTLKAAPNRLWSSLLEATPPPPFDEGTAIRNIPRDIPKPTSELVLRSYRFCCYLRIERADR